MKSKRYTVSGHWPFPLDMLRYDGARPAIEVDAALIGRLSGAHAPDRAALRERVVINLVTRSTNPLHGPRAGRWASFGWQVLEDASAGPIPPETQSAARDEEELRESALARLTDAERRALGY